MRTQRLKGFMSLAHGHQAEGSELEPRLAQTPETTFWLLGCIHHGGYIMCLLNGNLELVSELAQS